MEIKSRKDLSLWHLWYLWRAKKTEESRGQTETETETQAEADTFHANKLAQELAACVACNLLTLPSRTAEPEREGERERER